MGDQRRVHGIWGVSYWPPYQPSQAISSLYLISSALIPQALNVKEWYHNSNVQWQCIVMHTFVDISFEQAGIIMHTKRFEDFVWEEEVFVLGMPYFYIGKYCFASNISMI